MKMKNATEVFEVTRDQVESWDRDNWLNFRLDLDEGMDFLSVTASFAQGVWSIVARSDEDAVRDHEDYNEFGLGNVENGTYEDVEHEVWRIVDMPVDGRGYRVRGEVLRELEHIADALEEQVRSSSGLWGKRLVTDDLRPAGIEQGVYLNNEDKDTLVESIHLRQLVRNIVKGLSGPVASAAYSY